MDHLQQRRFARPVPTDEPDVLTRVDDERGTVEERLQTERELGLLERDERHPCDYPKAAMGFRLVLQISIRRPLWIHWAREDWP
jgi:hypothetical protein